MTDIDEMPPDENDESEFRYTNKLPKIFDDSENFSSSNVLFLGAGFAGKTTLMVKLLENQESEKLFNRIYLFSESENAQPIVELERRNPKLFKKIKRYDRFVPKIPYILHRVQQITGKAFYRFLAILDDCYESSRNKSVGKLFTTLRNSNIDTVLCTQHYSQITPQVRCNCQYTFILKQRAEGLAKALSIYGLYPELSLLFQSKDKNYIEDRIGKILGKRIVLFLDNREDKRKFIDNN